MTEQGIPPDTGIGNGTGFAAAFTVMLSLFGVLPTGSLATGSRTSGAIMAGGSEGSSPSATSGD